METHHLRRIAAGLVLGPMSLMVGGCGVTPSVPVSADTTTRAEALLLDLYEQVSGTVDDRRAQEFITHAGLQGPVRSCMTDAGFDYTLPPFYDIYAGMTRLPVPDTYLALPPASPEEAAVHGFGIGERVTAERTAAVAPESAARYAAATAAYDALPVAQQRAYDRQLSECQRSTPAAEQTVEPAGQTELRRDLEAVWQSAVESADVRAASVGYLPCLDDAGLSVNEPSELLIMAENRYTSFKVDYDGSTDLPLDDPGFAEAQEFERAAATADAECREETHGLAMAHLLPALEDFAEAHASQLQAIQEEWASIRAEADRLRSSADW